MKIIRGHVNIIDLKLRSIPDIFASVTVAGQFAASDNPLKDLSNFPKKVEQGIYLHRY